MNKFLPTLFLILVALFSFAQEDTICVNTTTQFSPIGNPALTNPWISSDVNIATIDNNGLATGVSAGACVITYTDEFNVTTNFDLVVEFPLNTNPVLVSAVGTDGQTLDFDTIISNDYYYQPLVDIVYQVGLGATIALSPSSQLPLGVTATVVGNTLTISGTPYTDNPITNPITFNYTVIGSGINSCTPFPYPEPNSIDGTITLNVPCVNTISQGYFVGPLCPGQPYSFNLTIGGDATGASVSGGANVNIIGNSVSISGSANGYGESFTVTSTGGGCIQASTTVGYDLWPNHLSINSTSNLNQTVCLGQQIEDIVISGIVFLTWNLGDFPAGIQQSNVINPVTFSGVPTSIGTYNFNVTADGHCPQYGSTSLSGTITVLPTPAPPTISGNTTILCPNSSIDLQASSANNYLWSTNETTSSITINSPGQYFVSVTDGTCSSNSDTITITAGTQLIPNITIQELSQNLSFCSSDTLNFIANTSNTGITPTYQWKLNGGIVGDNNDSLSITNLSNNDIITCDITSSSECPVTTISNGISLNIIPAPIISFGSASETTSCGGSDGQIQINGSGTGTVTWTGTASGSQNVILPIMLLNFAVGSYDLVFENGNGCPSNIVSATINEPPLPTPPSISVNGNTTICQGNSVILQSSESSGNVWSTTETTQSISVTTSGTYFVTVTGAPNCTATSNSITVTVNPIPAPPTISTSGATTFCQGGNVVLISSSASGNSWTGNQTTQSITVSSSGSYVVNVTQNGCTSANSAPVVVTVNPIPTMPSISASGPVSFCQGQSVTLTSDITSGIIWSPGGQTTPSITVTTADNFFVTNTVNGCSATSLVVSTSVNAIPTPTISAIADICNNASPITLTQGSPSGGIYTVNGVQMISFAPNNSNIGSNIVEYTLTQNGCSGSASTTLNVLNCNGVGLEETNLSIQLFPNPTNGIIEIKGIDKTEITSIKVYDQVGKLILIVANDNQINLSEYANGMYNLVIATKTFKSTQKIQLIK